MLFSWSDTSMCEGCQNKMKFLVELSQTKFFWSLCYLVDQTPPCVKLVRTKWNLLLSFLNQKFFYVLMLFSWSDTLMCGGCQNKMKFLVELSQPKFFCTYAIQLIRHSHVWRLSEQNEISCWAFSTQNFFLCFCYSVDQTLSCVGELPILINSPTRFARRGIIICSSLSTFNGISILRFCLGAVHKQRHASRRGGRAGGLTLSLGNAGLQIESSKI